MDTKFRYNNDIRKTVEGFRLTTYLLLLLRVFNTVLSKAFSQSFESLGDKTFLECSRWDVSVGVSCDLSTGVRTNYRSGNGLQVN